MHTAKLPKRGMQGTRQATKQMDPIALRAPGCESRSQPRRTTMMAHDASPKPSKVTTAKAAKVEYGTHELKRNCPQAGSPGRLQQSALHGGCTKGFRMGGLVDKSNKRSLFYAYTFGLPICQAVDCWGWRV